MKEWLEGLCIILGNLDKLMVGGDGCVDFDRFLAPFKLKKFEKIYLEGGGGEWRIFTIPKFCSLS